MKLNFTFVAVLLCIASSAVADDAAQIKDGRRLVMMMSCNDCHSQGFPETEGKLPENDWLQGNAVGFSGPWGTTYAANLRTLFQVMDQKAWIARVRGGSARPPMPWYSLQACTDDELNAIHAYIRSLGQSSIVIPTYVPPGEKPKGPYVDMMPKGLP